MLRVYSSTVLPGVRHRCLATVVKALYFSTPQQLEAALADLPISSFIASLLGGRDAKAQAYALQMGELLMEQLPHIFTSYFIKEGVVHAIQQLAEQSAAARGAAAAAAAAPASAGAGDAAGPSRAAAAPAPAQGGGEGAGGVAGPGSPPSPPVTRSRRSSQGQAKAEPREPSRDVRDASRDRASPDSARGDALAALQQLQQLQQQQQQRPPSRAGSVTLREAVLARAGSFKDAHFPAAGGGGGDAGGALLESDALRDLRAACAALPGASSGAGDEEGGGGGALPRLLALLTAADLSVFELLTSGAVKALSDFLRGADLPAGAAGAKRDELLLRRLRLFALHALAAGGAGAGAAAGGPPMLALVRKLQSALSSTEAFPVVCSRAGGGAGAGGARSLGRSGSMGGSFGGGGGSLGSGLQALMEPFKLRLVRHPNVSVGVVEGRICCREGRTETA
ncbi:E3 ubiquitin-protein ligase [Monoraphidium neglectum]|uniref:E3 ubiquitin-protein ligase n=1 Tax=Monoraphidium neglectum TaxID=145388 RepID=A0A0D2LI40_9CHLO|nr:E3 ubiquitin-protein ligase [Monoraphidium neglectum]KIY91679.1 E3 ubiquitin-protein ligase [Monoraphidium neglectum]|eukprot:XP_013890699.1 E3 ubiquitin-protein ligase [Monoraphidium neglectum]